MLKQKRNGIKYLSEQKKQVCLQISVPIFGHVIFRTISYKSYM